MLINELPDDCLLTIFGYMNNLDDLINCYKVCIKWSYLIPERTKKVKCLVGYTNNSSEYVYYGGMKPIDGTCLTKLFSNLIIIEVRKKFLRKVKREDIDILVRDQRSLKGLIQNCNFGKKLIKKYCDKLEMIHCDHIGTNMRKNGHIVKQLHLGIYTLDRFKKYAHCFPNLERLHIHSYQGEYDVNLLPQCFLMDMHVHLQTHYEVSTPHYYDGPVLENLKILELSLSNYCFQFMDSCPNLQSAHIFVYNSDFFVDESIKNNFLQDLVIDFLDGELFNWSVLMKLFKKYPNLKHLSLRCMLINDDHVKQLVHVLPHLVLCDVYTCHALTQRAAYYVQDYSKRYNRTIKFYSDDNGAVIQSDFPEFVNDYETIGRGFDFMKNCFLKSLHKVPFFLIPGDN